ncbi:MAG: asparaginyl-tRNA synthetase [Candidatus Magnetoglobus multicellularis str. Araruama]|uniref:Asparagine--tRNA ligase n=1 Tax=Candidatus Magnetoglobus multicellularis str. Araruama TaxID=890399 RepID=A0A1V1PFI0_9BACT|nr:MAG: asparaginyl-tRNA synthetase [Candidatus Magnetoglobus multicellularis str. Araruama]
MKQTRILDCLNKSTPENNIHIKGWIRTKRDSKEFSFIELNDGSCLNNIQIIANNTLPNYQAIKKLIAGSAISVTGNLSESPGKGQQWELIAQQIDIIGECLQTYPLQKKRHTDEFLRTIAHLRPRTNKYGAMFRIRSELSYIIHNFFHERGFQYIHTPIITGSDCEGAGELFQITTMDIANDDKLQVDFSKDFFGKDAYLTVSGQLALEMFALSLGKVYTFGPTFRAENSNTRRHAAEFWMIEPEMAFYDLHDTMNLSETFIRTITQKMIDKCKDDLDLFARFVDKNLMKTLNTLVEKDFARISYQDAVNLLKAARHTFEYDVIDGNDLQAEHEQYLTEIHFQKPVIVYNYPKGIKPFYMRVNADNATVAAMDVLVPGIGEIIGGSQREERYDMLLSRMDECGIHTQDYSWYLESRQYGSVPHSGFGLGLERFLMLITGVQNIRDVIPYPRTPKQLMF